MDEGLEKKVEPVAIPRPYQIPQALLEGSKEDGDAEGSEKAEVDNDLTDRFEGINLCGEEEIDLDFSEELEDLVGEVRWIAIFRVHTTKPFSHAAMFKQMRNAWAAESVPSSKSVPSPISLFGRLEQGDGGRTLDFPWSGAGSS
jgi:hypothetical protein